MTTGFPGWHSAPPLGLIANATPSSWPVGKPVGNPVGNGTTLKQLRQSVMRIRARKDLSLPDAVRLVFNQILLHEVRTLNSALIRGSDDRPYWYDGMTRKLYEIELRDRDFTSVFLERYSLIRTEEITKHVIASLEGFAMRQGKRRELKRFASYNEAQGALYLSRYDGTCWRLDGAVVSVVPNGEGALFIDDDKGTPCPGAGSCIAPNGVLLDALVNDLNFVPLSAGGATPATQQALLSLWLFAIAFPELLPAKPLLLLEGTRGSGKTSAIQRIQLALHGRQQTLTVGSKDEQDFGVLILRSPVALLDNMDKMVDWLQDALGAYTTGGSWPRRKKFTDDAQVDIHPTSFLAISTRNPATFRRDDIADRCLILRLDRRTTNMPLSQILAGIRGNRAAIYGEWLYYLNRIVAQIRAGAAPPSSSHRLADFAALAHVIGSVIGVAKNDVDNVLAMAQSERDVLTTEGDPLIDLIDRWLGETANQGRWVSVGDLHAELGRVAKQQGQDFHMHARTLGVKLRENAAAMARFFKIDHQAGPKGDLYKFDRA